MVARVASACLLAACCVQAAAGRQQDQGTPTFRSGVELVQLDVIVTAGDGSIVGDLTADDFEIREDGQLQRIAAFSLVDIPLTSADAPRYATGSFEPDVRRNDDPEGRLYVFVLDEVSAPSALRTRHHLRRFVEDRFAANDVGAVVLLGRGSRGQTQGFTPSRRLLLAAIDTFTGGFAQERDSAAEQAPAAQTGAEGDTGQDAAEDDLGAELPLPIGGPPPTARLQAAYDAASRMTALRDLMRFMASIPDRRKVVVFVSEGIGVNMFNVIDAPGTTLTYAGDIAREAMRAALRNNVAIYSIDPRGLSQSGGLGETNDPPGSLLADQESLRALAYVTGGQAIVGTNQFERGFEQMVLESSTYYLLGFYPTNDRRDGGYRRLDVRVRRPGLTVRARNGYFAPNRPTTGGEGAPAALESALASPLPVSGVPMRLVAAPYRGERNRAAVAVAVELEASGLDLAADRTGRIDLAYAVIDAAGRVRQRERADVSLRLQPRTAEAVARSGFRILLGPQLEPGVYQLRVAAATSRGRSGSVIADVEVPDFSKPPLAMSGVSITSLLTDSVQTAIIQDPLRGRLPRPVTARREFLQTDTLFVYTELYDNIRPDPPHAVRLLVELRTEGGRIAWSTAERRSSSELKGQRGSGFPFVTELPLDGIAPGRYIVHVEATADVRDSPTVSREVLVSVRPTGALVPTRAAATPERSVAVRADSGVRNPEPLLGMRSSDAR